MLSIPVPLAYISVILIWSTTPLAIKWSNETAGVLFGVTGRMLCAAIICVLLLRVLHQPFMWDKAARRIYFATSLGLYGSLMVTYWGAQFIPSGLISVLFGLSPIVTSLLAMHLLVGERQLNFIKWLGLLLGVLGLWIIFRTEMGVGTDSLKGLFAILLAVFLHCLSAVLIKRLKVTLSPLMMTTGGILCALPMYVLTGLILGVEIPHAISLKSLLAILYLGLFGSVLGFVLYFYLLKKIDAGRVALITLITPICALFLGQALNNEVIHFNMWLGAVIVLTGLSVYQWGDKRQVMGLSLNSVKNI
ncbi:DMT(drug/metabolite transporter) superfamily permease [Beggiatoa alba B18LD]|uniref:DMT(Drug/metabolite transporter) superfamily permease n=1 Tax=Beggiatoa alba B18LD TaxID=395493 RepID=I3CBQ1_9GAMM|nr:DMT family transporter [Beggiatoa alba]EIJ41044.1 DMT(drug/metabolite transporter) superfamily permease [Beggiatoa alba B18LD]